MLRTSSRTCDTEKHAEPVGEKFEGVLSLQTLVDMALLLVVLTLSL